MISGTTTCSSISRIWRIELLSLSLQATARNFSATFGENFYIPIHTKFVRNSA